MFKFYSVGLMVCLAAHGMGFALQETFNVRGADPGFPYPAGCLDRAGYVRGEDVGLTGAAFLAAAESLRKRDVEEFDKRWALLPATSDDEKVVKGKLQADRYAISGDLRAHWSTLQKEYKAFEKKKVQPPVSLLVGRAYTAQLLLEKERSSAPELIRAVVQAIDVLRKETRPSLSELVALSSFEVSYGSAKDASKTLMRALSENPSAYTVRMTLVWVLGSTGSSSEHSIKGPIRDRLNRQALEQARIIVEQDDTYAPALLAGAGFAAQVGRNDEAKRYYKRFLTLAPPDHKLRGAIENALSKL
jgi:tetratricopeptide (TPR) repeat protein